MKAIVAAFRAITLQYERKQVSGQESEPSAFLSAVLQIHLLKNSETKYKFCKKTKNTYSKSAWFLRPHISSRVTVHWITAQVITKSGVTVTMWPI